MQLNKIHIVVCLIVLGSSSFARSQLQYNSGSDTQIDKSKANEYSNNHGAYSYQAPANCTVVFLKDKPKPTFAVFNVDDCIYAELGLVFQTPQGYYPLGKPQKSNDSSCLSGQLVIDYGGCAEISFSFGLKDNKTYVKSINGFYYLNDTSKPSFSATRELFSTNQIQHYYRCNSEQSVPTEGSQNVTLHMTNFAFEANRKSNKTGFVGLPEPCALDAGSSGSDWLTVAVGVSLVGLVAIVSVAYFVGRNRWYARSSYESV